MEKHEGEIAQNMVSVSRIEDLPDVLLFNGILPHLDGIDLARLACCNTRLNKTAAADQLWYPLFISNYPSGGGLRHHKRYNNDPNKGREPPPYPWQTWHQAFCSKQNKRCIECKEHTPYVFTLLPFRVSLCERCEYTTPKYALVTELEARARYLLDDEDLHSLPFKKVQIKKFCVYFFLRLDVEKLARGTLMQFEGRDLSMDRHKDEQKISNAVDTSCSKSSFEAWDEVDGSSADSGNDYLEDEMLAEDTSNAMVLTEISKSEMFLHGSYDPSQDMPVQILGDTEHALNRGEKKALRKEHKRQVKAENREKRMGKKIGKDPHWEHSFADSGSKNSKFSKEVENAGENLNTIGRSKVKKKHRSKREHVAASNGAYREDKFLGYNSQLKAKSPSDWVKERDWLEVELGRYGISALELVRF